MRTITPRSPDQRRSRHGFTLVEVLVAAGLSGIILTAVLTSVLMIGRSGYLLSNYIEMEQEARTALETLAVDARVTESVSWHRGSDGVTLIGVTLTDPSGNAIRYDYDSADGELTRQDATSTRRLISGIQSLSFTAFQYDDATGLARVDPAAKTTAQLNDLTKMIQVSLSALRTRTTLAAATNNVVSARYVLRNKIQVN